MSIRSHHGDLARGQLGQDAGKDGPHLVGGSGDAGLPHQTAEFFDRDGALDLPFRLGQKREFLRRQAGQGLMAAGIFQLQMESVAGNSDVSRGQQTHDGGKAAAQSHHFAAFQHPAGNHAFHGQLQVGGAEADAVVLGADQHAAQGGDGVLGADRPFHGADGVDQIVPVYLYFHNYCPLSFACFFFLYAAEKVFFIFPLRRI